MDAILDEKWIAGKPWFLVKWTGQLSLEECTWHPATKMVNAQQVVGDWRRAQLAQFTSAVNPVLGTNLNTCDFQEVFKQESANDDEIMRVQAEELSLQERLEEEKRVALKAEKEEERLQAEKLALQGKSWCNHPLHYGETRLQAAKSFLQEKEKCVALKAERKKLDEREKYDGKVAATYVGLTHWMAIGNEETES